MSEPPKLGHSDLQVKPSACVVIGLLSCLATAQPAQAASFDCAKATTKIEKLICADAELSKLDDELNVAYNIAMQDEPYAENVQQTQKQWLRDRNQCRAADCVKKQYEMRLAALSPTSSANQYSSAAPFTLTMGNGVAVCEAYLNRLNASDFGYGKSCQVAGDQKITVWQASQTSTAFH